MFRNGVAVVALLGVGIFAAGEGICSKYRTHIPTESGATIRRCRLSQPGAIRCFRARPAITKEGLEATEETDCRRQHDPY